MALADLVMARTPPSTRRASAWLLQGLAVAAALGALALVAVTTLENLRARGLPLGLDFLVERAGFSVAETVLPFSPEDIALWAIAVGAVNTLFVSAIVCVGSTGLGLLLGIARLSENPLVARLAQVWVEGVRNTPPILLLIFIYTLWSQALPPEAVLQLGPATLTMRGLTVPALNAAGQATLTPELATILLGLTLYTTGFVAEIVRGGIQSVPRGQWEAARALGLGYAQTLRLVIIPQTLRAILPPMTSQYINIVKNSTLALAVGYTDFLTIMGTLINTSSHAVEGTLIIVAVYLAINLSISAALNRYNRRVALRER